MVATMTQSTSEGATPAAGSARSDAWPPIRAGDSSSAAQPRVSIPVRGQIHCSDESMNGTASSSSISVRGV